MILLPYKCKLLANAVARAYGRFMKRLIPFSATHSSSRRASVFFPAEKAAPLFFKASLLLVGLALGIPAWFVAQSWGTTARTSAPPAPPWIAAENNNLPEYPPEEEDGDNKIFSFPLILNDSVENELTYLTENNRERFQGWLDRSVRYLPLIKKIFREYNLPEDLAYLAMIESGFNPLAVSPQHAAGIWQIMVPTGREYGLVTDTWIDERKDPVKSTYAAAAHLKDLYNRFGSWPLVLASYNAGMGTVQSVVRRTRSDDYWDLSASRLLRRETRRYVPQYLAALVIARNPEAYGFVVPRADPFVYDEIVVRQSTDLGEAAHLIGCSYQSILELNPELIRKSTPPRQWYVLRIPPGSRNFYELRVSKLLRGSGSRSDRMEEGLAVLPDLSLSAAVEHESIVSPFGEQFALNSDDITCVGCDEAPLFLHQMQYPMTQDRLVEF